MHASSPPNARRGRVTPPTLVSMILRTYSAILLPLQCPETFRKHSFQVVKALPSSYRTSNCKDRSSRSYKDWDTQPCPSGFTEVMYSDREQPLLHTCLIILPVSREWTLQEFRSDSASVTPAHPTVYSHVSHVPPLGVSLGDYCYVV